jgi:CPA2 family monovalent cation:H+ antiporter-2
VALSSTIVALSLLERKGQIDSLQGAVAGGFALMQDLAVVPLIVVIPALAGDGGNTAGDIGIAMAKAAGLLVAIYVLGVRLVPWLFSRIVGTRSRELFLLAIVSLALGTAVVGFLAGLSLAFGAFLAGLLVSESEYAHETVAEVLPLREIFAVAFFVSIGMLIDPQVFVDDTATVLSVASVGIVGKATIVTLLALAFGYSPRVALVAGLALANMGEFSFVLMEVGVDEGIFSESQAAAVLAAVLLSIAASPFLLEAEPSLRRTLAALPLVRRLAEERVEAFLGEEPTELVNHAVVCGFGEAGRELARALERRNFKYVVIDEDPIAIRQLRDQGKACIYGDATSPEVLRQASLERARVFAITTRDLSSTQAAVTIARRLAPRLNIVVRGGELPSHLALQEAGATEVVHAEFEVGLEFVRHTLNRFGVSLIEIEAALARRRRDYYTFG